MNRRLPAKLLLGAGLAVALLAVAPVPPAGASGTQIKVRIVSGGGCTNLFCFMPSAITIAPGTKVKWKNTTGAPHTATRCTVAACGVSGGTGADNGPGSPTIAPGTKYQFVFHGAGTYVYYCQVHGYAVMHGTVTVT
jgi:plastocyanin